MNNELVPSTLTAMQCVSVRQSVHKVYAYALVHVFISRDIVRHTDQLLLKMECEEDYDRRVLLLALLHRRRKRRRRERKMWIRPIFTQQQEMRLSDPQSHFRYLRMSKERFDILLSQVGPLLAKRHYYSPHRAEIPPAERLAVTIRYLATGNSQVSLSFNFRMGRSTVCMIVRETCKALWEILQPLYVRVPSSHQEWKGVSDQFELM